jgi:hypothetical protein
MATRPAYVWTGSDWDDIGDKRLGASVTALNTALGSKLDLAGGKILQIVRATDSTTRTTTSTSFVDLNLSVTITPQKNDSAILLLVFVRTRVDSTGDDVRGNIRITDSSNNAISGAEAGEIGTINLTGTGTRFVQFITPLVGYATPAITSAVTYKLRGAVVGAGMTLNIQNASLTGQMYAIEVSA